AVGDTRSRDLLEGFVNAARAAAPDLPLVPYATRLRGWLLPLTRLSDNASFWDARYASLMLTDTAFLRNPHYHRVTDTSATLDQLLKRANDAERAGDRATAITTYRFVMAVGQGAGADLAPYVVAARAGLTRLGAPDTLPGPAR